MRGGFEDVQHEDNQPSRSFEWFHRGDDNGEQTASGNGRSIRPHTAIPPTVIGSEMGDGSLLLEGWRAGSSAYLSPVDAVPLRREIARAYGSTELARRSGQGENR